MSKDIDQIPTTPDPYVEKKPFPNQYASTSQKKTWSGVFPFIKTHNMELSEDPECITEVCDLLMGRLARFDWRWDELKNQIDRVSHKLYKSLYVWVHQKIRDQLHTVSQSSESQKFTLNADSTKKSKSGKQSRK